jgi:hypothetical protein
MKVTIDQKGIFTSMTLTSFTIFGGIPGSFTGPLFSPLP